LKLASIIFCAGFFVFGFGAKASAATIYIDPTCATPGDGTSQVCSGPTAPKQTWASLSWVAGNSYLQKGGTTAHETIVVSVSGLDDSHRTVIGNYGTGNATVDSQLTRNYGIYTNGHSYITIQNINFNNATTIGANIYFNGGNYNTVSGCSTNGGGSSIRTAGINDHIIIDTLTSSNASSAFGAAIYIVNAAVTNLSLSHVTITGSSNNGISLTTGGNISLSDIVTSNNNTGYYGLSVVNNASSTLFIDGIQANNNGNGIYIDSSLLLPGSFIKNFETNNNVGSGMNIVNTPNLLIQTGITNNNNFGLWVTGALSTGATIDHVTASYNASDGIDAANGVTGLIIKYNEVSYNGTVGQGITTGSGDGFSIHDTCSADFYYNIAHHNLNTGMAHTGTSSGHIYNNIIYANGTPSDPTMDRAGLYLTTSANPGFVVRNNIVAQNYPFDFMNYTNDSQTHNDIDYNIYYSIDVNKFYRPQNPSGLQISWDVYHQANEMHSINSNPLFVSSSDFHLTNLSPAINAGTNVGLTSDYEGNPKSGASWDIGAYEFQDSTAPTTTADINSGTYTTHQSVTLTCDDGNGVGCDKTYYTLTGVDPTTSSDIYSTPISIPDNATTVLKFFSQDRNLNSETIKSKTYIIDTISPDTLLDSNPNSNTASTSATFTFYTTETATFQCKLDDGIYTSCTSPKSYISLTDGSHTFSVQATDTATNVDATPASYTWTVDTTPPTISFSNDVEVGPTQSDTITADWGDATVKKWDYNSSTTCSTTASDYTKTDTDALEQTTQNNNTKYICLYAEDALGNKTTLASTNPINISLPVVTASNNDNHKNKSHHKAKPKPKTFQQKFTKKLTDTKKWFKKQGTTINRNLSLGSRGQDVGALQTALQKLGLLKLKDTTYGVYKSLTQQAVTKLQQLRNILPTGNFGTLTRNLFGW